MLFWLYIDTIKIMATAMATKPTWTTEAKDRFVDLLEHEVWAALSTGEKLSQNELGRRYGVPGSTVQGWLAGSIPETLTLEQIALTIGWSLSDITAYLKTGIRPSERHVDRIINELEELSANDLSKIGQAVLTFLAAERPTKYKAS